MNKLILALSSFILIMMSSCCLIKKSTDKSKNYSFEQSSVDIGLMDDLLINKNGYMKVKFKKFITGHLIINVTLNGVEGKFILDTGAGATVVEEKRKDKFSLRTEDEKQAGAGAGGAMNLEISKNNKFKINDMNVDDLSVYVMNLDHINNALKLMHIDEIDGVVGADVLSSRQGIIDYSHQFLYLKK